MAIAVQCPGCRSRLGVADEAAGKKVKCPKCAKMITVPGGAGDFEIVADDDFEVVEEEFEVVDEKPKPRAAATRSPRSGARDDDDDRPRNKKRKIVVDDDDEDDDEEDDRPRKKSKKKPAKSSNMPLLIGGGVLLVLLLAVGGYFAFGGKKNKSGSGSTDSWVQFSAPDGSFNVSMPSTPTTPDDLALAEAIGMSREDATKTRDAAKAMGINPESWMSTDGGRRYVVTMVKFPQAIPDPTQIETLLRTENKKEYQKYGTILGEEASTVAGRSASWLRIKAKTGKTYISAFFIIGDRGYDLSILDDGDVTLGDASVQKFINSFSNTRQSSAAPQAPAGRPSRGRGK